MKGMSFAKARERDLPPWLDNAEGRGWSAAQGAQQDAELALHEDSLRQRFPTTCDDSALDDVGFGFAVDRFKNETHASYRGRQRAAWLTWTYAGSKTGVTSSLEGWGVTEVALHQSYEVPGGWAGGNYAGFKVTLGPDFGSFGASFSPTADEKNAMIAQILACKSLHSMPFQIMLRYTGDLLGVDAVLGETTLGGTGEIVTVMPRLGVDFILGVDTIGRYKEY